MRNLEWPPLWLAAALALVWGIDRVLPFGLFGAAGRVVGGGLILAGLGLMGLASLQMMLARTTVIPHEVPRALVSSGVFRFSRNPIYLGDALVLTGVILWWDVPLALPLVPVFMAIIQVRFILAEEDRLRAKFGPEFEAWSRRTRRWL
ncbi:methyltransferase family protein [Rhodobacter ferrooxidans]|uniref:Isoprenylcysteine carboxyl methyltransferase family protein n=1 Tax=Rhodobacter ferrooxidans TaxID=371731 RepID=C8RY49_9RHOB|nr:isoprenylcysteine carboxylmethyltransferase family protein [Rhodobacter sp. SW2]EEW26447.1 isoprenylcysteine carboxyl methyltransferase family protein [Rhodobacter sp. SW2]